MNEAIKAAIYTRYSSNNQREESIEAQVRAIEEYAEANNIEITGRYFDEAKSATSDNRPMFLQMIKDMQRKRFHCIIIHKLDRFSRDRYDSAYYKMLLKKNNVKLISVLEKLDDTPESVILESVLEGMAEYYSKNLAREVMKGMRETALQCRHTGGRPPLGYDVTPEKTYIINEFEAEAVRFIFQSYVEGRKYPYIVKTLNGHGYKTKSGREFAKNNLFEILGNEKYTGTYVFNKSSAKKGDKRNTHSYKEEKEIIRIENGMPQIISKELFNKVKEMRPTRKLSANSSPESYLLSGRLFCGCCGSRMNGNKRNTTYSSYECSSRKNKEIQCSTKQIKKEIVEQYVLSRIPDDIKESTDPKDVLNFESTTRMLNNNLIAVERRINNLIDAIADGLSSSTVKEKLRVLEQEREDINKKIAAATSVKVFDSEEYERKSEVYRNMERINRYIEKVIYKDKENIQIIYK